MVHKTVVQKTVVQKTILPGMGDWHVLDEHELGSAEDNVARDNRLGEAVARGDLPPLCRLWENHQSLVVSRQETRLPAFQQAARIMTAEGWPVVVRNTGGSAVPHGPGSLQLSLLMPRSPLIGCSTDAIYRLLVEPLQQALSGFGVETGTGPVAEAFCDGRFNLQVAGKKIAGTAQVWRANIAQQSERREGYVLVHATLLVCIDRQAVTAAVNRFYDLAGCPRAYKPEALTTLVDCLVARGEPFTRQTCSSLVDKLRNHIIEVLQFYLGVDSVA